MLHELSATLHPICLPVDDFIRYKNLENTTPFVAGWGSVYFRKCEIN